jgi:molybdate transport system regulatory protein
MRQPFSITATLEVDKDGICFLNGKRIELLKQIISTGSILAASKEMGMSYQQAWTFVQQMNLLSPLPVVIRKRGGVNGGGAELTRFGQDVIERYERIVTLHEENISQLGEEILFCVF